MDVHCQEYNDCRHLADLEITEFAKDHKVEGDKSDAISKVQKIDSTVVGQKLKSHSIEDRLKALDDLNGFLYEYPIDFLHTDLLAGELKPDSISAEGVLPAMTFT